MKLPLIILTLAAVAVAAYCGFRPGRLPPAGPPSVDPASLHEGTLKLSTDPAEVFTRALWRRPSADDRILHAERREWTIDEAGGVAHWQWFLAVEPGAALTTWLRDENPFSLHPRAGAPAPAIDGAPAWFPRDFADYDVRAGGSGGNMVFLFSRTDGAFYATSSGAGFARGAP